MPVRSMKAVNQRHPRATIVMAARERHALAEAAIEAIVAHTAPPYRFVYLDVQSPDSLRERLARRRDEWGLEVMRFDEPLWPQEARNRLAPSIDTDYVVFIDNDVIVEDGWLDAMVACADQTGAGIVGPLYLLGDGRKPARIHMAGGKLTESASPEGRVLAESHLLIDADPAQFADTIGRQPCDFVEYHCMLIRASLVRDGTLLDPAIHCVHEHIDTALGVRQRGHAVYLEPSARVTYLGRADFTLDDIAFYRERWSGVAAQSSIDAFCRKWEVVDNEQSFGGVRQFVLDHVAQVDPIRPASLCRDDHRTSMRRDELKQTRSDLLDSAIERGYQPSELALLANAHHLAHILMDGGYRPCGRPFIAHLVGCASVLVRYGFRAETVAAGLLHSAYSHCPVHRDGAAAAVSAVCTLLGGKESALERRVRAYTLREAQATPSADLDARHARLSVLDAELLAISAANELDMHLSGEIRFSGRTDVMGSRELAQIGHACELLGVPGLEASLRSAQRLPLAVPSEFVTRIHSSYRIGPDKRSAVPMVGGALAALRQGGA